MDWEQINIILYERFGEKYTEQLSDEVYKRNEEILHSKYKQYKNKMFEKNNVVLSYEEWLERIFKDFK